jgi:hypothetical protein
MGWAMTPNWEIIILLSESGILILFASMIDNFKRLDHWTSKWKKHLITAWIFLFIALFVNVIYRPSFYKIISAILWPIVGTPMILGVIAPAWFYIFSILTERERQRNYRIWKFEEETDLIKWLNSYGPLMCIIAAVFVNIGVYFFQ